MRAYRPQRRHPAPPRWRGAGLVVQCCLAVLACGCGPTSFLITPVPAEQELQERVVLRESVWATRKLALIDVDGVLENTRERSLIGAAGENPVSLFVEKLERAARDQRVRAVVVRINSPGGSVTASDLMHAELRAFRQRTGKPVVAVLLDVGASGGYYVACAADRIYAHPTTVTGSIGVLMIAPEVSGTMDKLGIRANVIKSGALKDAGAPWREMNPHDRAVFEEMIQRMYERFVEVVRQGRPHLPAESLSAVSDGRVVLGPEARRLGLVDEVGTIHDALRAAREAAGLVREPILVVEYARPLAHRPNVYARAPDGPAQVNLVNVELPSWLRDPTPRLMYLWAPGW